VALVSSWLSPSFPPSVPPSLPPSIHFFFSFSAPFFSGPINYLWNSAVRHADSTTASAEIFAHSYVYGVCSFEFYRKRFFNDNSEASPSNIIAFFYGALMNHMNADSDTQLQRHIYTHSIHSLSINSPFHAHLRSCFIHGFASLNNTHTFPRGSRFHSTWTRWLTTGKLLIIDRCLIAETYIQIDVISVDVIRHTSPVSH